MRSPDCQVGKHGSCSGDAWSFESDEAIDCPCGCHAKEETT